MMVAPFPPYWLYFGLFPTLHCCLRFFGIDIDMKRDSIGRKEGGGS